jgi:hypothetical protein
VDYKRIYAEFIADRRGRESVLEGYSECHHIDPRSLGGSDAPDNLIRLSPEDHYFAHLLLARIHGARLASALFLLIQSAETNWGARFDARRPYGFGQRLAARLKAEQWRGDGNPLFNATEYRWVNYRSGEVAEGTLFAMHQRYGGGRPTWTGVLSGHTPSFKGWVPADRAAAHSHSEKGQVFDFVNRDGRAFRGTQASFAKSHGVNLASISRVVRAQSVTRCGWRRKGVADRPANYAKDGLPAHLTRAEVSGI